MGASTSRLTATIAADVRIPTLCWIAPLMPSARYSSGFTIFPVWPICWLYGIQPESTAARDAPTAPPSTAAISRTSVNPSGPPTPRPPDTMTFASSMGAAALASLTLSTTRTPANVVVTLVLRGSTRPAEDAGVAVVTLGLTVTIPRPAVKPDVVTSLPPNTFISTAGPSSVQVTAVALTSTPSRVNAETAPARSRPSAPAPTNTASGVSEPTSAARWPAATADQALSAAAGSGTAQTTGRYVASSVAAGPGSGATTMPIASLPALPARSRTSVAASALIRASPPSSPGSPTTHSPAIR